MDTGKTDKVHQEPIFGGLADTMTEFAKTDTGKNFRTAKAGKSVDNQTATRTVEDGDKVNVSDLDGDPEAIRKAYEADQIDFNEA
jgi:hypothetical protein